jgi:OFA family oxalate/formate antiporter-like MFS transporter
MAIFWPGTLVFGFTGVLSRHWMVLFDVGRADTGRILFFILVPVGLFMFFFGRLLERWPPQRLIAIGALCGSGSTFLLPLAPTFGGVYLWAFVMGGSTALVYLSGLTVVQTWHPGRRGLVSGLFNLCFGGSAALLSPLYSHLLGAFGYTSVAVTAAACVVAFGLAAAVFVRFPRPGEISTARSNIGGRPAPAVSMGVTASMRTRSFWMLWGTWAFAGAAGISMVTLSTSFGQARGLSPGDAVLLLTAFNVTNGLSRLVSGFLSDVFGRRITMTASTAAAGVAYFFIDQTASPLAWAISAAAIGYAFGTLFSVSAPLIGDCFGMDHFGAIMGVVFTAYGFVSGLLGPWLSGHLLDRTGGDFAVVFAYLGTLNLAAAGLILLIRPQRECAAY